MTEDEEHERRLARCSTENLIMECRLSKSLGESRGTLLGVLADRLEALMKWRPMEAAPRNGTGVLVQPVSVLVNWGGGRGWPKPHIAEWHAGQGFWISGLSRCRDQDLAGWLPLPPAP